MANAELTGVAGKDVKPRGFSFDMAVESEYMPRPTFQRVIRECILPHWVLLTTTIAAMAAAAATSGAVPFVLQKVGDEVFVAKNTDYLFVMPGVLLVLVIVRAATDWIITMTEASLGAKVVADLRSRMFDTIAGADLAWIQRNHSGRFVSAFFYDVPVVDRASAKTVTALFKNGLTVVFLLGAMFYMDWRLSLVVLIGAPLAIINLGRQKQRIRAFTGRSIQESGHLNSLLTQTLQSMRVVKAYGQEAREAQRLHRVVNNIRKYFMKTTRSKASIGPIWELMTGVGVAAVILYGGWQGIYGDVSLGHFMGFMTAALLALQPMKALAMVQATLSEGLLAAQRVFSLIDHASHVTELPGAKPLRVTAGAISFRDVQFRYDDGGPILSDFNLDIAAGQRVALVGPSGAGKSTVLNLILRFFDPTRGTISIDGQDLREVTLSSARAACALLTQEPVLFDDTISANIAYGSEDAEETEIVAAAKAAAAHDFIVAFPEGYETRVGEAGNRLSGGERQRIAFARAMLRNSPIVLLDEPTSALDAQSEAKIQAAMDRLLANRTVIMIAHRLSTVKKADRIFYMEAGRIVEAGTHAELVARRGRYAQMVQTQFLDYEPELAVAGR
jgi:subfamily B ATP-binding cassette protein MsbA